MPRQLRCCCVGTWSWGSWGWSLAGRRHRRWTSLSTTGRHQRWRISRRSDDNDSWMRTGSGRRGGGGRRARLDGDWEAGELEDEDERGVAAGAPCTTSNTGSTPPCRLGNSTMLGAPPPFSTPGHRRGQCVGAAGVAGYAVFPLPSPRPGPYETFYEQCECSPSLKVTTISP